jgi:hypothetical protein
MAWVGPVLLLLGGLVVIAVGISLVRDADTAGEVPQRYGLRRILDLLPAGREPQTRAIADRRFAKGLIFIGIGAFFVVAALVRLANGTP